MFPAFGMQRVDSALFDWTVKLLSLLKVVGAVESVQIFNVRVNLIYILVKQLIFGIYGGSRKGQMSCSALV